MPVVHHTSLRSNWKFTQGPGDVPWPVQPGGKVPVTVEITTITYDTDTPTLDYWMLIDGKGDVQTKQYVTDNAPGFVLALVTQCLAET